MDSIETSQQPMRMRRRLSFVLPALVFLSFAALERVELAAVADTVMSFGAEEPVQVKDQIKVMPAIHQQPAHACPHQSEA